MEWYAVIDGNREGPLTGQQLQALAAQGKVTAETQVWKQDMAAWQPAKTAAPHLFRDAPSPPPPVPAAAPAGGAAIGLGTEFMCSACGKMVSASALQELEGKHVCAECKARAEAARAQAAAGNEKAPRGGKAVSAFFRKAVVGMALAGVIVLCLPLMFMVWQKDQPRALIPIQAVASAMYVLMAVFGNMHRNRAGQTMFAALCLCWVGDLMSTLPFENFDKYFLIAYMAAYGIFMLSFLLQGVSVRWTLGALAVLAPAGAGVWWWLSDHIPEGFHAVVGAYVVAMSTFCALAVGQWKKGGHVLVTIGVACFYASDLCVAQHRLVEHSVFWAMAFMTSHYAALALLAFSVYLVDEE